MTYWKVLLAVFGVVPVLILLFAKQHMLLVFSFFVLVLLLRPFLKPAIERVPFGLLSKFVFVGLVFGLIAEGLAILDNLSLPSEQMQLFHSDVFLDLAIGVGFYAFWAVVWYFLLKKYVFKTLDVFVLGGLWGVVVEQNGAIFLSVFSAGLFEGLLNWFYVFVVYGSIITVPFLLFAEEFQRFQRERDSRKYVFGFLLQFLVYIAAFLWAVAVLTAAGKF